MIGKTLAHYKIVEKIGAGGMGEVYRASDSKLGRNVALKMVAPAFAQNIERMARFQREAQLLASLNHPNIAAIHGLEETGDSRFLVLELVEGPTLGERLARGPIPVAEALEMASQIADAVEFAHESGVIHRDLKPANVKITLDGHVKVLDFGLAKALEDPLGSGVGDPAASPTLSPTLSSPITGALTGPNVILGTAAYMSPEQARGHGVDKRADIWAFGVILFEMLTARRLFEGETVSDTLAAVLRKEPEWDALPPDTPPGIRQLLRRCLERKPKNRLRDIGDARIVIRDVLTGAEPPSAGETPAGSAAARRPGTLPVVAFAAAVLAFAAAWWIRPDPELPPLRKYAMPLPPKSRPGAATVAPDASAIAYVLDGALHLRDLVTLEDRELVAGNDVCVPFWSPDGQWIAYGAGMGLWKVRRSGGSPVRIATAPTDQGFFALSSGSWRQDGSILFTTGWSAGLFAVSAQGGEPVEVVPLGEDESDFHHMADLEGRGMAFIVHGATGFGKIDVAGTDGSRHNLVDYPGESLYDLSWSRSGHLLFGRRGDAEGVWALPFSLSALDATGAPFLVVPRGSSPSTGARGILAYVNRAASRETVLGLVDRDGKVVETLGDPARMHAYPSVSPDGRLIACRIREGETSNLWLTDVQRGSRRRFTSGPGNHTWGSWDPTGRDFWYFDEQWIDEPTIYVMPANGTGEPRVAKAQGHVPFVSPDGRWLLYTKLYQGGDDMDLWILDLSREDAEPQPLVEGPGRQWISAPSPTDPLVAYATNASGQWEVSLTTYPERAGDWPVSTHGGWFPQWRGDGRELFYAVGDSIMSVDVDAGDGSRAPVLSRPRLVFRRPRYEGDVVPFPNGFEVMPDGERFVLNLALEEDENDVPPALVIVQSWMQEFDGAR